MLIKFNCPHCDVALNVGSDFAGEKSACPNCKKELTIPEKTDEVKETTAKKQ